MVKNVDVLELTGKAFRQVYGKAYLDLVGKMPHMLGLFYDLMDRAPSESHKADEPGRWPSGSAT